MSRATGWWRHAALAGFAAGLAMAPALAPPAGWVACLAAGLITLGWAGRTVLTPEHPSPTAAIAWLIALGGLATLGGLGAGGMRLAAIERGALHVADGVTVRVRGYVAGFPQRSFGEVRVPLATGGGRVLAVVPEPVGDLRIGAEVRADGVTSVPAGGFARSRVERAGALLELRAGMLRPTGGARGGLDGLLDRARSRAEAALGSGADEEEAALARGFVLGRDDRVDPATREAFERAGLSHLLAVSGQNVMLLAALGGVVFAAFGAGLRTRLALTALLIAAYVPIAGAGPSIQRAGVMGVAASAATLAGRPSSRAYPLLLAAVVTLLIDPRSSADPGWQLSFAAVAGIALWARPLHARLGARLPPWVPGRLGAALAEGAALTIAATVATAPLIAHAFERVSLAALPANLVALPAIAPLMWVGMTIGMLAQMPAPIVSVPIAWLGFLEARLIDYVAAVADAFAAPRWAEVELALPGVAAPLATALGAALVLSLALAALRRRDGLKLPRPAALGIGLVGLVALIPALAGTPATGAPARGTLRVTELDVGQGDATLLQPGAGAPVLVDGGPPSGAAAEALAGLGIERLRAVVVSHDEIDHAGGLAAVLDRFEVGTLVHARPAPELQAMARGAGVRVVRVAAGSELRFGRLALVALWPPRDRLDDPAAERNDDALVLLARFRGWDVLLSADAEQEVTHLDPGPIDVLKVAHHGSDDAGLEPLLERSMPRVALIGVGAGNPYGHPTAGTTAALAGQGVCTLRTDLDGAAAVELGPDGLSAWTERGPPPPDRAGCGPPAR